MPIDTEQNERLAAIGWRGDLPDLNSPGLDAARLVRVVVQHRNAYIVHDGTDEFSVQPAPRFLRRDLDPIERPAVGDFVLLRGSPALLIETVLPRRTVLSRGAAGEHYKRQLIATNIDHVLVLMGLDGDFNAKRLHRYFVLIEGSGAQGVVVLTKADRHSDVAAAIADVATTLPPPTPIHAVNAKDLASLDALLGYFGPGHTVVLVGSSGVGKSTLTNTLLGKERMATNVVREHDSRGKHTTTFRALLKLPQGGCLIDTPGMRELKLTGEEDVEAQFDDIEALSTQCRFGDCVHHAEPGCAVRAALEAGTLDADRWHQYTKLRGESEVQAASLEAQLKRKAHARVQNKALNKRLREKYDRT